MLEMGKFYKINKLIRCPFVSPIEYNLIDLHRMEVEYQDEMLNKKRMNLLNMKIAGKGD